MLSKTLARGAATLGALALGTLTMSASLEAQEGPPSLPEGTEWKQAASGLRYAVIKPGEGDPVPETNDQVTAHYTGWLKDGGKKFDSSVDRGQPFEFTVGRGVIRGWSEGVQLMPKGAKFRFEIPASLGYGARGAGGAIPPNATLIFDIELLDVKKAGKPHPFVEATEGKQIEIEKGMVYEVLKEGEGDKPEADTSVVLHFTIYKDDGTLLQSSKTQGDVAKAAPSQFRFPLFQKALLKMNKGSLFRVEATKEAAFGPQPMGDIEGTVWFLELIDIMEPLPVPEFERPSESELQKSDSGLQWKVVKEGKGESPKRTDTVRVHYAGRLLDGTLFDNSFSRGEPSEFPLNGVIKGWTEGLAMMKPGETRVFVIPSELAYGERGSPPNIKPNSDLMFWVELVEVVK